MRHCARSRRVIELTPQRWSAGSACCAITCQGWVDCSCGVRRPRRRVLAKPSAVRIMKTMKRMGDRWRKHFRASLRFESGSGRALAKRAAAQTPRTGTRFIQLTCCTPI